MDQTLRVIYEVNEHYEVIKIGTIIAESILTGFISQSNYGRK